MREKIVENQGLIEKWDYSKNKEEGNDPEKLTCGSSRIVWWKCRKGHSFKQAIDKKARNPKNCPVCSGHRTVIGVNDFATLHPDIAKEWHPTKNGDLKPNELSEKNGRKVWWICKYGHEWEARIHDRVGDHTGCPICSARRNTSFPEQAIYYYVRKLYPDTVNRYKDIFDNQMELDVYIPSRKIGIEFDGGFFHQQEDSLKKERIKYGICKENGIKLIRIKQGGTSERYRGTADTIYGVNRKMDLLQMSLVIQTILDDLDPESNMWTRRDPRMIHSKIHVNLYNDMNKIKEYLTPIKNSLVDLRPDLVKEWHPTKNGKLKPEMFGINSNDKAWWKCKKCGYEWQQSPNARSRGIGCPCCSGRVPKKGVNDIKSLKSPFLKEWDYDKNGELKPEDFLPNSGKKIWWKCSKCGHEWQTMIRTRNRGHGCPKCNHKKRTVIIYD